MSFIARHYEKFLLILPLFIISSVYFFQSDFVLPIISSKDQLFSLQKKNQLTQLSLNFKTSLLPGDSLYYRKQKNEDWSQLNVDSIVLERNSPLNIFLINGEIVSGDLKQTVLFAKGWNKSSTNISLRVGRQTVLVPLKEVSHLEGMQILQFDNYPNISLNDLYVSFYQRTKNAFLFKDFPVNKWTQENAEENSTGYELFTPPIIYVHEGALTTRLPEKKEEIPDEPFGINLKSSTRTKYPFRLISWIGQTPYFEDLSTTVSDNSDRAVRNRIEVGKYYKKNVTRKPGQPSLIQCSADDESKLLIVEKFVVQQHKNAKSGGLRPVGRAMVRDFKFDKPFEVNSLMDTVYAGDVSFVFEIDLPSYKNEEIVFSSSSNQRSFVVGGRLYEITLLDLENNVITVSKTDPRLPDKLVKSFNF